VDSKQTGLESDEAVGEHLNKEIERSTIANERENSLHFYQKREIKKSRTIFYSSIVILSSDCWL
jgi:phosphoribosylaminoimidazole carboxylase (NCAIR synthetase)